jgi:glyoxylase-like metal-dependent hydrolase (beta-lactamase superfamily II)
MIEQIEKNVWKIYFNNFGSNCYIIKLKKDYVLIDTSSKENKNKLIESLKKIKIYPKDITKIILTHAHYDHVENINLFENAKIYSDFNFKINQDHTQTKIENILPIEKFPIKIFKFYKTPGHTKNDIIILYENILFSGDVIFNNGYIGRTDFPESNPNQMQESLTKIKNLKFDILCPGH